MRVLGMCVLLPILMCKVSYCDDVLNQCRFPLDFVQSIHLSEGMLIPYQGAPTRYDDLLLVVFTHKRGYSDAYDADNVPSREKFADVLHVNKFRAVRISGSVNSRFGWLVPKVDLQTSVFWCKTVVAEYPKTEEDAVKEWEEGFWSTGHTMTEIINRMKKPAPFAIDAADTGSIYYSEAEVNEAIMRGGATLNSLDEIMGRLSRVTSGVSDGQEHK